MNKQIILINQNAGYLTIDIANAYARNYDKVVLMAGIVKPMERELNSKIYVQKIIKLNRSSAFKRIFTWGWSSLQIFFLLLLKYHQYEVIYFTNPPMAYLSSLLIKNKFSLVVYDTYPDALKNIGINEKNLFFQLWSKWNKKLFDKANKIITLSNGMAEQLSFYIIREKITVVHNWSGSDKFAPIKKDENPFIKEHHLAERFVVLYSGNMGYTHSVETIIEVAKILNDDDYISFLFIGEGQKKEKLQKLSEQYNLKNCIFMTWQSADNLPYSLASANLSVVTLNEETALFSVPSKTYNLMAVGSPLLCIAPNKSELSFLVAKYKNGKCFQKDQVNEIASFILALSKNHKLQKELSDKSLAAAKDFNYSNALKYL